MTTLDIETLTQIVELCFANSRNNEIFSLEQRRQWLIKGMELQQRLVELIGQEMSQDVAPTVTKANQKIKAINERLKNTQETLHKFNDTIQQIIELVNILDIIIGFVAPRAAVALEVKAQERILNCIPSREIEKDWEFANALEAEILAAPEALPPSVDLRDPSWWEIANQTNHGACVGFAAADILWWHFVQKGVLPKDKSKRLSRRFIWMAAKEMDEFNNSPTTFLEKPGTSLKAALDIARKYGCVLENELQFEPEKLSHLDQNSFYALAAQFKISSYFNLRKPSDSWQVVQNAWKTWLATHGPILTRLNVDSTWDNAKQTQGNLDIYQPATSRGGHAVSIVGYTPDRFIIRNSWGTELWGDNGFGYASLGYAEAAFTEAYGIAV
jgi:hypothetical protein